MKVRIRRHDRLNWVVERFSAGGAPNNLGSVSKDRWTVTGWHSTLERACRDALTELIPVGAIDREIIDALRLAQEAICQALSRASGEFLAGKVSEVMEIETPSNPLADS